ncbi:MAG TPA: flagellar basal body P-ring formation chaperone FlgA [Bryobacteraceae bacterium]|nr:flagellar basal body P-ring formation chaperone FlgA [Bryobacteraceae bacterium]
MSALRILLCLAIPCGLFAQPECLTVTGDQILGRDLARAVPALARIPHSTPLAPAPIVGNMRVFTASELQSIAARFSLPLADAQDVCFRFATEPLDQIRLQAAMKKALAMDDAHIEILETTAGDVPKGTMEFTREGLGVPATPDQTNGETWRGNILYGGVQRFPIWAKVRVTVPSTRLIAVESLRPGAVIRPEQVHLEVADRFPQPGLADLTPESVAGMAPVRSISAGAEIRRDNLLRPNDVNRGDTVQVDVRFGGAHLSFNGHAESGGHIGDTVSVRNPETNRMFQAIVAGSGRVFVGNTPIEISRREGY